MADDTSTTSTTSTTSSTSTTATTATTTTDSATSSYTGSQAQVGRGTTMSISGALVGELTNIPVNLPKWGTVEVTNLDSGDDAEYKKTIRKASAFTAKGNRVPGDAGQAAVRAAYDAHGAVDCVLTLPKTDSQTTVGDTYSFKVLVLSYDFNVDIEKAIDMSIDLQITGKPTYTAGS